ncbi:MAG: hypothetical protein Q7J35_16435 [Candidatus Methanoperedens sp.]|nr:hypothetical protein [Candidatus Methanoperedens sp.]
MLETAQERVKLLKKGLSQKEIEMLYIEQNNFKIIRTPILYDANEFDAPHNPSYPPYFQNHVHNHMRISEGLMPSFPTPLQSILRERYV